VCECVCVSAFALRVVVVVNTERRRGVKKNRGRETLNKVTRKERPDDPSPMFDRRVVLCGRVQGREESQRDGSSRWWMMNSCHSPKVRNWV
jgi:hypothetical protein